MKNARRLAGLCVINSLGLMFVGAVLGSGACSSGGGSPAGSGGASATGGSSGGTGGVSGGTGGNSGTGGGSPGSGGGLGSGGTPGTGGVQGTGGASGGSGTGGAGGAGPMGGTLGTAARPLLTPAQAATDTIANYLAQAGAVTAPIVDNWGTTAIAGVDISAATPMFTVAATGGTHTTVQAAISAAVAVGGANRIFIQVMPGTYREPVCVLAAAPPITLYSTDATAMQTIIVFNNLAGTALPGPTTNPCIPPGAATTIGTDGSATLAVFGANFQAKNLTVTNDGDQTTVAVNTTQGVALHSRGDKAIYDNVRFHSHQDTILVKTGNVGTITRSYFKGGLIEGDVDFICGRGTAVFDGTAIHFLTRTAGGTITAPSTAAANPYGFLIINSMLMADVGAAGIRLGRAWDEGVANAAAYVAGTSPNGQLVIRDSVLSAGVPTTSTLVWSPSTAGRAFDATMNRLYEFNNTGPGAAVP